MVGLLIFVVVTSVHLARHTVLLHIGTDSHPAHTTSELTAVTLLFEVTAVLVIILRLQLVDVILSRLVCLSGFLRLLLCAIAIGGDLTLDLVLCFSLGSVQQSAELSGTASTSDKEVEAENLRSVIISKLLFD